jgi:phage shock protein PspC (stress-responsive transcriptional regulator)
MSLADEIQKLDALRASGALTDAEYARAKERVLGGEPAADEPFGALKRFRRSSRDCWFGGVCGGLGEMTPVPSWAWRIAFCVGLFSFGVGLIPYILLWIFVPADNEVT